MANYIQSLREKIEADAATIAAIRDRIDYLQAQLCGPKYQGTDNGERKDWVAVSDVQRWLTDLKTVSHGGW